MTSNQVFFLFHFTESANRVLATGGAASNKYILQVRCCAYSLGCPLIHCQNQCYIICRKINDPDHEWSTLLFHVVYSILRIPVKDPCVMGHGEILAWSLFDNMWNSELSFTHCVLQVIADVFGLPVFTFESTSGAALGAAYRAKHGLPSLPASTHKFRLCTSFPASTPKFRLCTSVPASTLKFRLCTSLPASTSKFQLWSK
jgi:hypothetical protein